MKIPASPRDSYNPRACPTVSAIFLIRRPPITRVSLLWEQLLASVPSSRPILHVQSRIYQEKIRDQFADAKIAPNRLEFVPRQGWEGYIQTLNLINIALNTLGHATALARDLEGIFLQISPISI